MRWNRHMTPHIVRERIPDAFFYWFPPVQTSRIYQNKRSCLAGERYFFSAPVPVREQGVYFIIREAILVEREIVTGRSRD